MKKLQLNVDELAVESFEATTQPEEPRGTVRGHNFTDHYAGPTCVAAGMCSGGGGDTYDGGCVSVDLVCATRYPECVMME